MTYIRDFFILLAIAIPVFLGLEAGKAHPHSHLFQQTYMEVCDLIRDNYFEDTEFLQNWVNDCHMGAKNFPEDGDMSLFLKEVESQFQKFTVSHLAIWDPLAMRAQWMGESKETGIRARSIKGHLIVTQLVENGPAQKAGIELGDEILTVNDKVGTEWSVRQDGGVYSILRENSKFNAQILPEVLRIDEKPFFEQIEDQNAGILTIPSFVPTFFEKDDWLKVVDQFLLMDKVIIDVRHNAGGNFAAMLRALSPFFCKPTVVGNLIKPRKKGKPEDGPPAELDDNLDFSYQQELIENRSEIVLKTYADYPCFSGDVVVLIDGESASSTEVFAQAFMSRPKSKVFGDFSAGEVVQAVWHPLSLGSGFAVSIPDSMYYTPQGQSLEGVGVRPLKILEYDLSEAREGVDSWVQEAL
jgi:carboxyl-terminal processing protease